MKQWTIYLVLTAILLTASPLLATVSVGDQAPDFTLQDIEGNSFKLSSIQGKIVVLFFLGYNCGSCLVEAPYFELNIHKQYQPYGVEVLGIDIWDGSPALLQSNFISATGATFKFLTYGSPVAQLYGAGVSNYMIIGIDGKVKFISRYYDERGLQTQIDVLTSTPGQKPKAIPDEFVLHQNFPNPFNPSTQIEYEIVVDDRTPVDLVVYDLLGNEVAVLVDADQTSGFYSVSWDGTYSDGRKAASGLYFYQLSIGERQKTRKMHLVR